MGTVTNFSAVAAQQPALTTSLGRLQSKPILGASNDPLERSADQLAAQALAATPCAAGDMSPGSSGVANLLGHRKGTALEQVSHVFSGGRPMEAALQQEMELRFGHDFAQVRIHTDGDAQRSALEINAQAFVVGKDIVFGSGHYSPGAQQGKNLLAHELAHVVQQTTIMGCRSGIAPVVCRRPDPRLELHLENLRLLGEQQVGPYGTDDIVAQVFEVLHPVDLSDPDNLAPISQVVSSSFPAEVLMQFLAFVEDRARKDRIGQLDSRHPLGPGAYGLFPVSTLTARASGQLAQSFLRSSQAFLEGLFDSLEKTQVSEAELQALRTNLLTSTTLNVVLAPVFLAGATMGIARDAKDTVLEAVEVIGNFSELVDQFGQLIHELLTDQELARLLGEETGTQYVDDIRRAIALDPLQFVFQLGCLIGPTIVWTVLSLTGITALATAALFMKLKSVIGRFPRVVKIVEAIEGMVRPHSRLPESGRNTPGRSPSRLSHATPALSRMFAATDPLELYSLNDLLPELRATYPEFRVELWSRELPPGTHAQVSLVNVDGGCPVVMFQAPDDKIEAHTIIHEVMHIEDMKDGRIQAAYEFDDMPGDASRESLIDRMDAVDSDTAKDRSPGLPMPQRLNRELSEFVNAIRDSIRWRGKEGAIESIGLPEDAMLAYGVRLNSLIKQDGIEFIDARKQEAGYLLKNEWGGLEVLLGELGPQACSRVARRMEREGAIHAVEVLRTQFPEFFSGNLPSSFQ